MFKDGDLARIINRGQMYTTHTEMNNFLNGVSNKKPYDYNNLLSNNTICVVRKTVEHRGTKLVIIENGDCSYLIGESGLLLIDNNDGLTLLEILKLVENCNIKSGETWGCGFSRIECLGNGSYELIHHGPCDEVVNMGTLFKRRKLTSFEDLVSKHTSKMCRVDHKLIEDYCNFNNKEFYPFACMMEMLAVDLTSDSLRKVIHEGKWYIQ